MTSFTRDSVSISYTPGRAISPFTSTITVAGDCFSASVTADVSSGIGFDWLVILSVSSLLKIRKAPITKAIAIGKTYFLRESSNLKSHPLGENRGQKINDSGLYLVIRQMFSKPFLKSSRRLTIIWLVVLSHHRTYGSVYGGSIV